MMFSTRSSQTPPGFFVKTQGFEKRFFVQHFKKYFGDDVVWLEGTDMRTVRPPTTPLLYGTDTNYFRREMRDWRYKALSSTT